jgi:hypothetical protein
MKMNAITWDLASVDDSRLESRGRGARLLRTTWSRRPEPSPRKQPKAQTEIGDKLTAMIQKAESWKLNVRFEDESFEPVISHKITKR